MIRKVGRTYWLDLWIGKKRYRRSLKTSEFSLATARAQEIARELKAGPGKQGATFADFSKKYMDWAWQTKPSSALQEKYRVEILVDYLKAQGVSTLAETTPYHVEQFRAWIMQRDRRAKERDDRPVKTTSRSTANRYCALLRVMFQKAADWGFYAGPNPVSKVKFFREAGKVRPLEQEESERVVAAARAIAAAPWSPLQRAIADLILFSLNTGLRRAEALLLRWRDVKDDALEIKGKREKTRLVPLNSPALAVLSRQPRKGEYVFDIPNRARIDVLRRTIVRIRKLSGVEHFHFHLCRHYFATRLLAAGVDIQTVADLLGHSRIMTSLLYSHSSPERMRAAVSVLEGPGPADTKHGHSPLDSKSGSGRKKTRK